MKLDDVSFRKLDQKWVAIDRKKDVKKINKILKEDFSYDPVLGYIYIDHENGITLSIAGPVIKEDNLYHLDDDVVMKKYQIPYDEKINFQITFLEEKITSAIKGTTQIEIDCQKHYENKAIIDSRQEEDLDEFRHEYFPDDLELLLVSKDDEEYLWGRLEAYSPKHKVAICNLITDSIYNEDYKDGSQVFAKLEENGKEQVLKIDKLTNQKEQ